jgi:predicted nucleotidyltransferase
MQNEDALAIQTLRQLKPVLRERFGVTSLAVFGSVARGDAGPLSDIDILVRFGPQAKLTLFALSDLDALLTERLGRRVDTVADSCLNPRLAPYVAPDLIEI